MPKHVAATSRRGFKGFVAGVVMALFVALSYTVASAAGSPSTPSQETLSALQSHLSAAQEDASALASQLAAPTTSASPVASPTNTPSPSPSPSPTSTASPSPSSTPISAWPDASNTGVPVGTQLIKSSGFTVTKAGAVISGLDVTGCISIDAPNVTIENVRVTGGCTNIIDNSSTGLIVRDSEIIGTTANAQAIGWSDYTLTRVNIHGTGDGARANGNVTIEDSYIHGLVSCSSCHNDGIQVTEGSNITIRHNAIDNAFSQTSAVMVGADQGAISDILVTNNLVNGGGYTLYAGGGTGIVVTDNHFGKKFFANCGYYGPANISDSRVIFTGNIWDDTGKPVS